MRKAGQRSNNHHPLVRILAVALLLLISYGSTVEAMHGHGDSVSSFKGAAAGGMSDAGNPDATTKRLVHDKDCLICQLHRNLFSSLLNTSFRTLAETLTPERAATRAVSYHPAAAPRRSGRAPPSRSLV
jgi:hypothetical protein